MNLTHTTGGNLPYNGCTRSGRQCTGEYDALWMQAAAAAARRWCMCMVQCPELPSMGRYPPWTLLLPPYDQDRLTIIFYSGGGIRNGSLFNDHRVVLLFRAFNCNYTSIVSLFTKAPVA